MEIFDWSATAAGNGFAAPDGFPEGMNYSDVNNAAREIMAVMRRWYGDTNGSLTTSGSGNAYTLTSNQTISSYTNGLVFSFTADRANTGSATLDVSGVGASTIYRNGGSTLLANDIVTNGRYTVTYNTTLSGWVLNGHVAVAVPTGSIIAHGASSAPTGYLPCDGAEVSRTTYAALFAVVGTTYGVGDGSTTFDLPDLRGEFLRGLDGGRGIDTGRTMGSFQDWATLHVDRYEMATGAGGSGIKTVPTDGTAGDYLTTGRADGGNRAWRLYTNGEDDNRPRNVAVFYCIKT